MNEVVKRLIEKATLIYPEFYGTDRREFDKEKFAGLLVQECADIARKSGAVANNEQAKIEATRIYHKIQDHFGD